nr:glutaredoxin family protein [Halalkalibacter nanhaiisediminis]
MDVQVFSKVDCPLCDEAIAVMRLLQDEVEFRITVVDIYQDDSLLEKYQLMIPVVVIDGEEVDYGQVSMEKVRKRLLEKTDS